MGIQCITGVTIGGSECKSYSVRVECTIGACYREQKETNYFQGVMNWNYKMMEIGELIDPLNKTTLTNRGIDVIWCGYSGIHGQSFKVDAKFDVGSVSYMMRFI